MKYAFYFNHCLICITSTGKPSLEMQLCDWHLGLAQEELCAGGGRDGSRPVLLL